MSRRSCLVGAPVSPRDSAAALLSQPFARRLRHQSIALSTRSRFFPGKRMHKEMRLQRATIAHSKKEAAPKGRLPLLAFRWCGLEEDHATNLEQIPVVEALADSAANVAVPVVDRSPTRSTSISWCCHLSQRCMAAASISCTTPRPQRSTSEPVTKHRRTHAGAPQLQKLSILVPSKLSCRSHLCRPPNWSLYWPHSP